VRLSALGADDDRAEVVELWSSVEKSAQQMLSVRPVLRLFGAIVTWVVVTTSAHAVQTTLLCTMKGTAGGPTRQQHVTISIDQDVWGIQEEGKTEVKAVRGVTVSPARIFLRGGDPAVYTIWIDRLNHIIRLAAQTKESAYFQVFRRSCKEIEFRPLRKRWRAHGAVRTAPSLPRTVAHLGNHSAVERGRLGDLVVQWSAPCNKLDHSLGSN
jgi:hypothetical protein